MVLSCAPLLAGYAAAAACAAGLREDALIVESQPRFETDWLDRLIRRRLRAGVLEDGVVCDRGMGQGSAVSSLLVNVYLHCAFDLGAERGRRREDAGDVVSVHYADDIVVGFEHDADARRFQDAMRERLDAFALAGGHNIRPLVRHGTRPDHRPKSAQQARARPKGLTKGAGQEGRPGAQGRRRHGAPAGAAQLSRPAAWASST